MDHLVAIKVKESCCHRTEEDLGEAKLWRRSGAGFLGMDLVGETMRGFK